MRQSTSGGSQTMNPAAQRLHSTPDPESPDRLPPDPKPPVPDDVPDPVNAPVEEPGFTDPPIRAD